MNKQAYLRMMNYGMRKNASLQERQILYKIATMYKQQGWLDDVSSWWQKGGSMKAVWTAIINWFKRLFEANPKDTGAGANPKDTGADTKPTDTSTPGTPTSLTKNYPESNRTISLTPTDSNIQNVNINFSNAQADSILKEMDSYILPRTKVKTRRQSSNNSEQQETAALTNPVDFSKVPEQFRYLLMPFGQRFKGALKNTKLEAQKRIADTEARLKKLPSQHPKNPTHWVNFFSNILNDAKATHASKENKMIDTEAAEKALAYYRKLQKAVANMPESVKSEWKAKGLLQAIQQSVNKENSNKNFNNMFLGLPLGVPSNVFLQDPSKK